MKNASKNSCSKSAKCKCKKCAPLNSAISFFGNQTSFARKLQVKQPTVSRWFKNGVPPERAIRIEKITKGKVSRKSLCPLIYA